MKAHRTLKLPRPLPGRAQPARPTIRAVPIAWETIGRGILFVHLLVAPLAFSQSTVEGFEFVKYLVLVLTALCMLALAAFALPKLTWIDVRNEFRQPLVLAAAAFLASALLSTIFSVSPHTSLYGHYENFEGLVTLLSYFVLFLAARRLIGTPEQMRIMFVAVATAAGLASIYGFLQAFRVDPFDWTNYSVIGAWRRPFATFGNPNLLGAYLVLALPPIGWLAIGRSWPAKAILGLLVTAAIALTALTLSRGAWLGMAAAIGGIAFGWRWGKLSHSPWRLIAIGLLALGGAAAAAAVSADVRMRAARFFDSSGRLGIWSWAWAMFLDRPLAGWGLDTFPQVFGRYGGVEHWSAFWGESPGRAHNELLHILTAQGVCGGAAGLAGLLALAWTISRAWQAHPERRGLCVALAASLAGYFVTEMFGFVVIPCGSLAVVLAAFVSRLEENRIECPLAATRRLCAAERVAPGTRKVQFRPIWHVRLVQTAIVLGACWLAVYLAVDPWRADQLSCEAATLAIAAPEESLRLHERAVLLCPHEPVYWNRLAQQAESMAQATDDPYTKLPLLERACAGYSESVACDREDGFYFEGLGRVRGELARYGNCRAEDAYDAFDAALFFNPANAHAYVEASRAALHLANAERMKQYTDQGLRLYPNFGPLLNQVAMRWLLMNRPVEAIAAFNVALKGDWTRGIEEWQQAVAIFQEVQRRMETRKAPANRGQ
jgi:O-antigen ligase/tetratricopeptide (TPR) repeat protein